MTALHDWHGEAQPKQKNWFGRFFGHIGEAFALLKRPPRHVPSALAEQFARTRIIVGLVLVVVAIVWQSILFDPAGVAFGRDLPRWLVRVFGFVTEYGKSGYFLWPLAVALIALAAITATYKPSVMIQRVLASLAIRLEFLFLAIAAPGLFVTIIKRFIGRARPNTAPDYAFAYHPFKMTADYASLPSGHATTAFAAMVAFGMLWPRTRPWFLLFAVMIAVSRVVVGAHHVSDVIVGAIVGSCGALFVAHLFANRRLAFAVSLHGEVIAKAGPSGRRLKAAFAQMRGR